MAKNRKEEHLYSPWSNKYGNKQFEQYQRTSSSLVLKVHSHISVLWRSCRISVIYKFSFLGARLKTKSWKSRIIFIFRFCFQMHAGLFFDHYFDFLSVETDINKSRLNLINLEELEVIKRRIPATWLTICLNQFEFDVIFKTKYRKSQKIFIFWIHKAQMNGHLLFDHYFKFLGVKTDTRKNRAQID